MLGDDENVQDCSDGMLMPLRECTGSWAAIQRVSKPDVNPDTTSCCVSTEGESDIEDDTTAAGQAHDTLGASGERLLSAQSLPFPSSMLPSPSHPDSDNYAGVQRIARESAEPTRTAAAPLRPSGARQLCDTVNIRIGQQQRSGLKFPASSQETLLSRH